MPIFALLQQTQTDFSFQSWTQLATQFGGMGLLAYFLLKAYREDRKASEERYEKISMDFLKIVTDITKSITSNTEVCRTLTDAVGRIKREG